MQLCLQTGRTDALDSAHPDAAPKKTEVGHCKPGSCEGLELDKWAHLSAAYKEHRVVAYLE